MSGSLIRTDSAFFRRARRLIDGIEAEASFQARQASMPRGGDWRFYECRLLIDPLTKGVIRGDRWYYERGDEMVSYDGPKDILRKFETELRDLFFKETIAAEVLIGREADPNFIVDATGRQVAQDPTIKRRF